MMDCVKVGETAYGTYYVDFLGTTLRPAIHKRSCCVNPRQHNVTTIRTLSSQ